MTTDWTEYVTKRGPTTAINDNPHLIEDILQRPCFEGESVTVRETLAGIVDRAYNYSQFENDAFDTVAYTRIETLNQALNSIGRGQTIPASELHPLLERGNEALEAFGSYIQSKRDSLNASFDNHISEFGNIRDTQKALQEQNITSLHADEKMNTHDKAIYEMAEAKNLLSLMAEDVAHITPFIKEIIGHNQKHLANSQTEPAQNAR